MRCLHPPVNPLPVCVAAGLLAALSSGPLVQDPAGSELGPEEARLVETLAAEGVRLEPLAGRVSIPATVEVIDDLLEYLLVGPGGARHETVFTTQVSASVLNVGLLALGAEPGTNASWSAVEPRPSEEELRAGALPYTVVAPGGDALYLYAGWRRGEECYLYRIEDLVRDLMTGQTMRRHPWVYLGSRMLEDPGGGEARFAADVYQNYINIAWFRDGNTLLTAALPECVEQTIWMSNAWLLPGRGEAVSIVFARERIDALDPDLVASLPDLGPVSTPYSGADGGR